TLAGSTFDSRTDAVATSGEFIVPNGSSLRLVGNPGSTGTIRWNSTGGETRLLVGEPGTPDVTIPAGGEFIFNGNSIVDAGVSTATLTNNAIIRGMGTFGYFGVPAVVNRNRIDADVPGEFLNFRLTSATNSGTIRALSGGALRFEVGTLDNSGGTIRAESGSQLLFSGYPRTVKGGSVINAVGQADVSRGTGVRVAGGAGFLDHPRTIDEWEGGAGALDHQLRGDLQRAGTGNDRVLRSAEVRGSQSRGGIRETQLHAGLQPGESRAAKGVPRTLHVIDRASIPGEQGGAGCVGDQCATLEGAAVIEAQRTVLAAQFPALRDGCAELVFAASHTQQPVVDEGATAVRSSVEDLRRAPAQFRRTQIAELHT
ncbi:MAG: hypothetical protein EOP85_21520, partial [Verrucomicrobiaceae bacterium]